MENSVFKKIQSEGNLNKIDMILLENGSAMSTSSIKGFRAGETHGTLKFDESNSLLELIDRYTNKVLYINFDSVQRISLYNEEELEKIKERGTGR